jgi:hypothetical protein
MPQVRHTVDVNRHRPRVWPRSGLARCGLSEDRHGGYDSRSEAHDKRDGEHDTNFLCETKT